MKWNVVCLLFVFCAIGLRAEVIAADLSDVRQGPIAVTQTTSELVVRWQDRASIHWSARFSLDSKKPLLKAIEADGKAVVQDANPVYRCTTGKRRGGWDAFFDFPPSAPEGTRQFLFEFHPTHTTARTVGDRVEVTFDGAQMGIFRGDLRYTFYPRSSLIQQTALLSTDVPDTAYFYDAGLQMASPGDVRAGGNMATEVTFYNAQGDLTHVTSPYGSERHTLQVHYRAVAAKTGGGSLVVFPPPHRYFFARDYTTNQGYAWYSAWRGRVGLGVQQYPDDNTGIDPWMNAPPGSRQEMSLFLLPSVEGSPAALKRVLAYTHADRFPHVDGFITFAPHWHLAYMVQAMEHGLDWVPPFKPVMEAAGIDAAMIMDFHLDGHPYDLGETRLHELAEYYKACRAQSDSHFLLIPAEEANVYLGGHWGLVFPKPVFWTQRRKPGQPYKTTEPGYGTVYHVQSPEDVWKMVTTEGGWVYQTHPRTKGSTGYPDKLFSTDYFRDPRYLGSGWKSMPSDLSLIQLGDRAFKTIDDLNNLGLHKHMIGEIDVFQLSPTDELYGLLNLNYLRLPKLPDFDHYDEIFKSIQRGDGFISTGEITLPHLAVTADGNARIEARAEVQSTFPLRTAEIVWGDGKTTHREAIDLSAGGEFADRSYTWSKPAPGWTWARLEVWDVAGNGAFTQPVWNEPAK